MKSCSNYRYTISRELDCGSPDSGREGSRGISLVYAAVMGPFEPSGLLLKAERDQGLGRTGGYLESLRCASRPNGFAVSER